MIGFLLNLVLAIVWALLMGSIGRANLVVGFLIGYAVLWLVHLQSSFVLSLLAS